LTPSLREQCLNLGGPTFFNRRKRVNVPPKNMGGRHLREQNKTSIGEHYVESRNRNDTFRHTSENTRRTDQGIQGGVSSYSDQLQTGFESCYLDSPGLSPLLRWGDEQFGQARGLCLFPPTSCQTAHSYPKQILDSQKYIFLRLRHGSLREDRWPGSKNMGHAAQSYSTEMQPSSFDMCIFHFLNYPHTPDCISLHKNIRTSNSEAIAYSFSPIGKRHDLEDMASFYHYCIFLHNNIIGRGGISCV